ncbi:MAG: response regulator [Anaerolineae bacterium]|nr:response regulator [Anaerolineae bacterium]
MAELMRGQILRILLVTTRPDMEEHIRNILSSSRFMDNRLHWVSQPNLAHIRARDLLPHIILVDDDLDDIDPIPIIRQMASTVSNAAILFMVDKENTSEASQAVLVGARSFISKPFEAEDLVLTLNQVLAWQRVPTVSREAAEGIAGRIIVFCAPKGGTGRSTLAINTAISLHQDSQQPVVLVDADYAAPALDVALNLHQQRDVSDLLPKLSRLDEMLVESVLADHSSGIKVLLAPPPADLGESLSLPQVQHILVMLKRMFPWVIVDLGLPMDDTAFAFLDGADRIIMTVLPEMIGLRNSQMMLEYFQLEGYPPEKIWLVLNRSNIKGGVSADDIESRLGVPVTLTVPDDQPLITHTVNRGVPLTLSHRRSAVSRAIHKISRQLVEDFSTTTSQQAFMTVQRPKRQQEKDVKTSTVGQTEADADEQPEVEAKGTSNKKRKRRWLW